jgi:hypothetical protein
MSDTRGAPMDASMTFVWQKPDDETAVFSIEFAPSTPEGEPVSEEMGRFTHDEHGWAGMASCKETLEATAEAIGAGWVER